MASKSIASLFLLPRLFLPRKLWKETIPQNLLAKSSISSPNRIFKPSSTIGLSNSRMYSSLIVETSIQEDSPTISHLKQQILKGDTEETIKALLDISKTRQIKTLNREHLTRLKSVLSELERDPDMSEVSEEEVSKYEDIVKRLLNDGNLHSQALYEFRNLVRSGNGMEAIKFLHQQKQSGTLIHSMEDWIDLIHLFAYNTGSAKAVEDVLKRFQLEEYDRTYKTALLVYYHRIGRHEAKEELWESMEANHIEPLPEAMPWLQPETTKSNAIDDYNVQLRKFLDMEDYDAVHSLYWQIILNHGLQPNAETFDIVINSRLKMLLEEDSEAIVEICRFVEKVINYPLTNLDPPAPWSLNNRTDRSPGNDACLSQETMLELFKAISIHKLHRQARCLLAYASTAWKGKVTQDMVYYTLTSLIRYPPPLRPYSPRRARPIQEREEKMKIANAIFNHFQSQGIVPLKDAKFLGLMLEVRRRIPDDVDGYLALWKLYDSFNIPRTETVYTSHILWHLDRKRSDLGGAIQAYDQMRSRGILPFSPECQVLGQWLLCLNPDGPETKRVVDDILACNDGSSLIINRAAMLRSSERGDLVSLESLVNQWESRNPPSRGLYFYWLRGCYQVKNIDVAMDVFVRMLQKDLVPTAKTYTTFLYTLGRIPFVSKRLRNFTDELLKYPISNQSIVPDPRMEEVYDLIMTIEDKSHPVISLIYDVILPDLRRRNVRLSSYLLLTIAKTFARFDNTKVANEIWNKCKEVGILENFGLNYHAQTVLMYIRKKELDVEGLQKIVESFPPGYEARDSHYSMYLDTVGETYGLKEARTLLKKIPYNDANWARRILGKHLAKEENVQNAIDVIDKSLQKGQDANSWLLNMELKISLLSRTGKARQAYGVYQHLRSKGGVPDPICVSEMLRAMTKIAVPSKNMGLMYELMKDLDKVKYSINYVDLERFIWCHVKIEQYRRAVALYLNCRTPGLRAVNERSDRSIQDVFELLAEAIQVLVQGEDGEDDWIVPLKPSKDAIKLPLVVGADQWKDIWTNVILPDAKEAGVDTRPLDKALLPLEEDFSISSTTQALQ